MSESLLILWVVGGLMVMEIIFYRKYWQDRDYWLDRLVKMVYAGVAVWVIYMAGPTETVLKQILLFMLLACLYYIFQLLKDALYMFVERIPKYQNKRNDGPQ